MRQGKASNEGPQGKAHITSHDTSPVISPRALARMTHAQERVHTTGCTPLSDLDHNNSTSGERYTVEPCLKPFSTMREYVPASATALSDLVAVLRVPHMQRHAQTRGIQQLPHARSRPTYARPADRLRRAGPTAAAASTIPTHGITTQPQRRHARMNHATPPRAGPAAGSGQRTAHPPPLPRRWALSRAPGPAWPRLAPPGPAWRRRRGSVGGRVIASSSLPVSAGAAYAPCPSP